MQVLKVYKVEKSWHFEFQNYYIFKGFIKKLVEQIKIPKKIKMR